MLQKTVTYTAKKMLCLYFFIFTSSVNLHINILTVKLSSTMTSFLFHILLFVFQHAVHMLGDEFLFNFCLSFMDGVVTVWSHTYI